MKLLRVGDVGHEKPAVLDDHGIARDLSMVVRDIDGIVLSDGGLERIAGLDPTSLPILEGRIGSPIARPNLVLCVGLNYEDHARETGAEIPDEPILFQKATNTVIGPFDSIRVPPGSTKTDWEVELGIVIGEDCLHLADRQAGWEAIAGYAISHDVSEREFQLERQGQWTKGKSYPTFNPLGPWLVTPDDIDDVLSLDMTTKVNGEVMQEGNTKTMIFDPGYLVWYISQFMRLEAGDLINSGTPPGVGLGMDPERYLAEGDEVEISIAGLGAMRQRVGGSGREVGHP